jgi:hypothetical protein
VSEWLTGFIKYQQTQIRLEEIRLFNPRTKYKGEMSQLSKLYLSSPSHGRYRAKYVNEAFDTNWVAPLGPNVDNFENV